ncbi:MAG: hypothetical protein AB7U73_01215 [Pirellulales bacterium]
MDATQAEQWLRLVDKYGLAPLLLLISAAVAIYLGLRVGRFLAPLVKRFFDDHSGLVTDLKTNSGQTTAAVQGIHDLMVDRGQQLDRVEFKLNEIHEHLTGDDDEEDDDG